MSEGVITPRKRLLCLALLARWATEPLLTTVCSHTHRGSPSEISIDVDSGFAGDKMTSMSCFQGGRLIRIELELLWIRILRIGAGRNIRTRTTILGRKASDRNRQVGHRQHRSRSYFAMTENSTRRRFNRVQHITVRVPWLQDRVLRKDHHVAIVDTPVHRGVALTKPMTSERLTTLFFNLV